jgi:hypothetical protein
MSRVLSDSKTLLKILREKGLSQLEALLRECCRAVSVEIDLQLARTT